MTSQEPKLVHPPKPNPPNLFYLIRHGESESNKIIHSQEIKDSKKRKKALNANGDPCLTPLGCQQAFHTAKHLFDKISEKYSSVNILVSPLKRTKETADPFIELCKKNNFPFKLVYDPNLQEYTSPQKQVDELLTHLGEPLIVDKQWSHFTDRVLKILKVLREPSETPFIIFGHSQFFSVLLSYFGSQETYVLPRHKIVFHLPNCCITTFSYYYDHWRIYYVANILHLPKSYRTGQHI